MSKPTVAVVGASSDRAKWGNISLRAHEQQGYEVYPVNIRGDTVEGHPVYRTLADIPVELDRVTMYLPPRGTFAMLEEIAAKGCGELWLNPGTANDHVVSRARELGLNAIEGCSIVALGISPSQVR